MRAKIEIVIVINSINYLIQQIIFSHGNIQEAKAISKNILNFKKSINQFLKSHHVWLYSFNIT